MKEKKQKLNLLLPCTGEPDWLEQGVSLQIIFFQEYWQLKCPYFPTHNEQMDVGPDQLLLTSLKESRLDITQLLMEKHTITFWRMPDPK